MQMWHDVTLYSVEHMHLHWRLCMTKMMSRLYVTCVKDHTYDLTVNLSFYLLFI